MSGMVVCNMRGRCDFHYGECGGSIPHYPDSECGNCPTDKNAQCIELIDRNTFRKWRLSMIGKDEHIGQAFMKEFFPDVKDYAIQCLNSTARIVETIKHVYVK